MLYPWLTLPHLPDMQTEDMSLLAKSFPNLQKWIETELAKNKKPEAPPQKE